MTSAEEGDALVKQVKLLGYVFAALILALAVHTVYVSQAPRPEVAHHAPTRLEAEVAARSDLRSLPASPVEGQVVYVPAYSHIYQLGGTAYPLTVTLSVRNTSLDQEIVVDSIRYFDTKGKELKAYLERPVKLPALGTTEVVVERQNMSGGSGANFLVQWHAKVPVTEPIIEAVMVGTTSQQALAFARRGVVISVAKPVEGAPGSPQGE